MQSFYYENKFSFIRKKKTNFHQERMKVCVFIRKVLHLASLSQRGSEQLGSGLFLFTSCFGLLAFLDMMFIASCFTFIGCCQSLDNIVMQ